MISKILNFVHVFPEMQDPVSLYNENKTSWIATRDLISRSSSPNFSFHRRREPGQTVTGACPRSVHKFVAEKRLELKS